MERDLELRRLLRQQHGVVTARQLVALGYSRGQIMRATRRWTVVAQGVFIVGTVIWEAKVAAALAIGGDEAVLGQEAAAYEWGIFDDEPRVIVVWAPTPRKDLRIGETLVRFRRSERRGQGNPRRTPVEDTLLDIASDADELSAVAVVTRALADRLTTTDRLRGALGARERVRHRRVLQEVCDLPGAESVLEYLFVRNVLRPHGLPLPDRQVATAAGRVDSRFEGWGLVVELDGARYHRDKGHDYHRDNLQMIHRDDRTLRFGWRQCAVGACESAAQVEAALRRGGWTGSLTRTCACPEGTKIVADFRNTA